MEHFLRLIEPLRLHPSASVRDRPKLDRGRDPDMTYSDFDEAFDASTGNRPTSIDLFAGAGGLTEGLREAGFTSLYANEVVPRYAATFRQNHPGVEVEDGDIRGRCSCGS